MSLLKDTIGSSISSIASSESVAAVLLQPNKKRSGEVYLIVFGPVSEEPSQVVVIGLTQKNHLKV